MGDNFYRYQQKRTTILLGWGVGNVLVGLAGSVFGARGFWRQFWLQAFSWGGIDAVLAGLGLRAQNRKLQEGAKAGPDNAAKVKKDITGYHNILLLNVFLDLGYIVSGEAIRRRGKRANRPDRQGIGLGFQVQGLFLFIYDLALTLEVRKNWLNSTK